MSSDKTTDGARAADAENTGELRDADEPSGVEVLEDALGDLEPGTILAINRIEPRHARGFLEDVELSAQDLPGLRNYIKRNWGGGKFKCQWKRRLASGTQRFGRGCAVFTVMGPPLYHGRKVRSDGTIEDPAPDPAPTPAPAPAPVYYHHPAPAPANRDYAAELLGQLVPLVINKADGSPLDIVKLVGALQSTIRTGSEPDPFGQVERTLGLLTKLRDTFGDGSTPEPETESSGGLSDLLGGGGGIEKILALKLLGPELGIGHTAQQNPSAPPGWRMTPQGWQPIMPQQQPQTPPPPPGWTYGPKGWERITVEEEAPEPEPREADAPEPEFAPSPETKPEPEPDEYEDPMTAEELAQEITDRPPEEQQRVLIELMSRMGIDPTQAETAFQQVANVSGDTFPSPPIVIDAKEG